MANIVCAPRLGNVGPLEPAGYPGGTVREVLEAAAADYPRLKNYLLDDHGRVRKHVAIFVGGALQPRETVLDHDLGDADEVYVMQALSGG